MLAGLSWAFVVGADRLRAAQSDLLERLGTHIGTQAAREALMVEVMGLAPLLAAPGRDAEIWKRQLEEINGASGALARRLEELEQSDRKLLRYAAAHEKHTASALTDPESLASFVQSLRALEAATLHALDSFPPPKPGHPTNHRARGIAHLLAGAYRKHIGALPSAADQSPFVRFLEAALDALGEDHRGARRAAMAVIKDMRARET